MTIIARCSCCGSDEVEGNPEPKEEYGSTLVGYYQHDGHDHDDNCWTKYYWCHQCNRHFKVALRHRCPKPNCNWESRTECDICGYKNADYEWPTPKYPYVAGHQDRPFDPSKMKIKVMKIEPKVTKMKTGWKVKTVLGKGFVYAPEEMRKKL